MIDCDAAIRLWAGEVRVRYRIGEQVAAIPEVAGTFEVTGVATARRSREEPRTFVARALKSFAEVAESASVPPF